MNDHELDDLLRAADPAAGNAGRAEAIALANETFASQRRRAGMQRRMPALAAGVAVLALTAAGTTSAYLLSIPPFQTLEPGLTRTTHGVPVDGVTDAGTQFACLAFVEAREPSAQQREAIETMVTTTDWSGYGQRQYDALPQDQRQLMSSAPGPLAEVVIADLRKRASAASGLPQTGDGPRITGGAISCDELDQKQ